MNEPLYRRCPVCNGTGIAAGDTLPCQACEALWVVEVVVAPLPNLAEPIVERPFGYISQGRGA